MNDSRNPSRPLVTLRIYHSEGWRGKLGDLLSKWNCFDELWFRTPNALFTRDAHREASAAIVEMGRKAREAGCAVTLEIGEILGHFALSPDKMGLKYTRDDLMVGSDGAVNEGTCCLASEAFRNYVADTVEQYCRDFRYDCVYIDDDMRPRDHGAIQQGCFCRRCLAQFSKRTGHDWSREELADIIRSKEEQPLRAEWIAFHAETVSDFLAGLGRRIRDVSPGTHLAFENMNATECFYDFDDVRKLYAAIHESTGVPARVRIGGDRWTDYEPRIFIKRSLLFGGDAQDARECGDVDVITQEIENHPQSSTSRSHYSMLLEAALGMAYGCNSTTFQLVRLPETGDDRIAHFLDMLAGFHPLYATLREFADKGRTAGLTLPRTDGFALQGGKYNPWWYVFQPEDAENLAYLGIPVLIRIAAHDGGDGPIVLTAEAAKGLSREDFQRFYRRGLLLSGNAFLELERRGFTQFTGVTGRTDFTAANDHLLSSGAQGAHLRWNAAIQPVAFVLPEGGAAEPLAKYDEDSADLTSAWRFEDENGRMAVLGAPGDFWTHVNRPYLELVRDLCDWLGKAPMPVRLHEPVLMTAIPTVDDDGRFLSTALLNCGIEPQTDFAVTVRRPAGERLRWLLPGQPPQSLPMEKQDGEVLVRIPRLEAWQLGLLYAE